MLLIYCSCVILMEQYNIGIGSSMKMKEVQEICQKDSRWNALRTAGEKKQSLAINQVTYCTIVFISFFLKLSTN